MNLLPRKHTLQCYSFSSVGYAQQVTDKIILPVPVMAEADRCALNFPLYFKIKNTRAEKRKSSAPMVFSQRGKTSKALKQMKATKAKTNSKGRLTHHI